MKIERFILLDDVKKEEIVFLEGVFFATHHEGNNMFDVFKLYDFYVTFCHDLKNFKKPTMIAHICEERSTFCMN